MVNIIDEDYISCPICLEVYYANENKIPLCLECGHTLCKKCLESLSKNQILECPIDKRRINFSLSNQMKVENLIIKDSISIIKSLQINVKPLTKLSMYYCNACDMFISNWTKDIHWAANHEIQSIPQYTYKCFIKIYNNIEGKVITPVLQMYFLAYFYQSDNFKQIKKFKIIQILKINNKRFTFYGENYLMTDKNMHMFKILRCMLTNNEEGFANFTIKKGIIIGINSQIMQGFFLFNWNNPNIVVKGFGVLNYQDISFFGLVSLIPDPDHSGFAFDFGVIKDNFTFLYGIFNHNFNEYPLYSLAYGEEITLTIKGIHVIRKKFSHESEEEPGEPILEIPSNNQFFMYTNNHLKFKPAITNITNCHILFQYNNSQCEFSKNLKEISFIMEINNSSIIKNLKVKLKDYESSYDYDYNEKSINDWYIILNSVNILISSTKEIKDVKEDKKEYRITNDEDEVSKNNSVIISDDFDYDNRKNFNGYKISPKGEELKQILQDIAKFKLKNIIYKGTKFLNLLEELLTFQLIHSKIEYQIFNFYTLSRVNNGDYLTINCEKGVIKCHYPLSLKSNAMFYNDDIKTMIVLNLLPDFFSSPSLMKVSTKIKMYGEVDSQKVKCYTCCILI